MSKNEIDAITAEFFGAFDNRGGKAADVVRIHRLVIPGGVIVLTGPKYTVYTVDEFVEPRERLLADGRLVEFSEWETSERTEIAGDIALKWRTKTQRFTINAENTDDYKRNSRLNTTR
ncbi:hypothetical protein O1L55_12930, partial [Streptomyces albulus]|nr:hypothetical protein [Streptomyces noursei]